MTCCHMSWCHRTMTSIMIDVNRHQSTSSMMMSIDVYRHQSSSLMMIIDVNRHQSSSSTITTVDVCRHQCCHLRWQQSTMTSFDVIDHCCHLRWHQWCLNIIQHHHLRWCRMMSSTSTNISDGFNFIKSNEHFKQNLLLDFVDTPNGRFRVGIQKSSFWGSKIPYKARPSVHVEFWALFL